MTTELQNVTCPLCGTDGFSATGLRGHNCNGVSRRTGQGAAFPRRRLTPAEYVAAVQAAKNAQTAGVLPPVPASPATNREGGPSA